MSKSPNISAPELTFDVPSYLRDIPWVRFVRRAAEPGEGGEANTLYGIKDGEDVQRVIAQHFSDTP